MPPKKKGKKSKTEQEAERIAQEETDRKLNEARQKREEQERQYRLEAAKLAREYADNKRQIALERVQEEFEDEKERENEIEKQLQSMNEELEEKEEWERHLKCSSFPDVRFGQQTSGFLSSIEKDDISKDSQHYNLDVEFNTIEQLTQLWCLLEEQKLLYTDSRNMEGFNMCNSSVDTVKEMIHSRIDRATAWVLENRFLISTEVKEGSDQHELKISRATSEHAIKLGIWANMKGKAGRMKVVHFHDLLVSADVPKQIANMDVALRLSFTPFDNAKQVSEVAHRVSREVDLWRHGFSEPPKGRDGRSKSSGKKFSGKGEKQEDEEEQKSSGAASEGEEKEEEEDESSSEDEGEEKEADKEDTDKEKQDTGPQEPDPDDPEDATYYDPARTATTVKERTPLQPYEMHQIRHKPLAGLVFVELLSFPEDEHTVKKWTLANVSPLAYAVERRAHPLQGQGSAAAAQAIKVRAMIPTHVIVPSKPDMAFWDPSSNCWSVDEHAEAAFDVTNRILSFKTSWMRPLAPVQPRWREIPYKHWHTVPVRAIVPEADEQYPGSYKFREENQVLLEVHTRRFRLGFLVGEYFCRLVSPIREELSHILFRPLKPGQLLGKLLESGIQILPLDQWADMVNQFGIIDDEPSQRESSMEDISTEQDVTKDHESGQHGNENGEDELQETGESSPSPGDAPKQHEHGGGLSEKLDPKEINLERQIYRDLSRLAASFCFASSIWNMNRGASASVVRAREYIDVGEIELPSPDTVERFHSDYVSRVKDNASETFLNMSRGGAFVMGSGSGLQSSSHLPDSDSVGKGDYHSQVTSVILPDVETGILETEWRTLLHQFDRQMPKGVASYLVRVTESAEKFPRKRPIEGAPKPAELPPLPKELLDPEALFEIEKEKALESLMEQKNSGDKKGGDKKAPDKKGGDKKGNEEPEQPEPGLDPAVAWEAVLDPDHPEWREIQKIANMSLKPPEQKKGQRALPEELSSKAKRAITLAKALVDYKNKIGKSLEEQNEDGEKAPEPVDETWLGPHASASRVLSEKSSEESLNLAMESSPAVQDTLFRLLMLVRPVSFS